MQAQENQFDHLTPCLIRFKLIVSPDWLIDWRWNPCKNSRYFWEFIMEITSYSLFLSQLIWSERGAALSGQDCCERISKEFLSTSNMIIRRGSGGGADWLSVDGKNPQVRKWWELGVKQHKKQKYSHFSVFMKWQSSWEGHALLGHQLNKHCYRRGDNGFDYNLVAGLKVSDNNAI